MGSPAIFNGNFTKLLTSRSVLGSDGSLVENDGSKNLIRNATFENGSVTGWGIGNVGALTNGLPTGTPVFGTAAATLSFAPNSTTPIDGAADAHMVLSAASTAGDMFVSNSLPVPLSYQAKNLSIYFDYSVISGAANINLSGTLNNSLAVALYDVTNSSFIAVTGAFNFVQNSGVATFTGNAQTNYNTANVRLCVYMPNASTGAFTLAVKNFYLGKQPVVNSPAMSDWVAYTPTFTGFGTVGSVNFYSRRVGGSLEIQGSFVTGTTTSVAPLITLGYNGANNNVTIDTSKIGSGVSSNVIGKVSFAGFSSTLFGIDVLAPGPTSGLGNLIFGAQSSTTGGTTQITAASSYFGASQIVTFFASVPILGWSSNTVSSADYDGRIVSWNGTQSSQAVTANVTDIAFTTVNDRTGSWNGTQFKVQSSGDYVVMGNATLSTTYLLLPFVNGTAYSTASWSNAPNALNDCSGSTLLTNLKAGDLISLRSNGSCTVTNAFLGIYKLSGNATPQQSESVNFKVIQTSAQSLPANTSTTITFGSKLWDSHGQFNLSTGIWTATRNGKLRFSGSVGIDASQAGYYTVIYQYRNGTQIDSVWSRFNITAPNIYSLVSGTFNLLAGDTVYMIHNPGTAVSTVGDARTNFEGEIVGN